MNTAARFMQAARHLGDGIYCDEATYHSARGLVNFQKLPPLLLKGKAEPMRVFRLAAPASKNKLRPPLLGRQAERTALAQSLQDLCDGKGTVVFIEGEPGIGKSRLLQDLLESASQRGLRSLSAGTEALEKLTSYYVWRGIVSQLLGIAERTELSERRLRVNSKLAGAGTTGALAPLLNTLLVLDLAENDVTSQMTGELRAVNLNQLLLDLVRQEAEQAPLLIVLEDAHWMDSASWALTLRLALEVKSVLLAISSRPLADPAPAEYQKLIGHPATKRLILDVMREGDSSSIVCRCLGIPAISPQIVRFISSKAEGNPFFIEELSRALCDRDLIAVKDGVGEVWPGKGELDALDMPGTIRDVIASRLGQLEPSQQMIVKLAAVIGRAFSFEALHATYPIAEDRPHMKRHLDRLQHLDIIRLERPEPQAQYSFKHVIIQLAAYDMMLAAERRQLHEAVAGWYERTFADDLAPYFQLLAHHWNEAANRQKAVAYSEQAGDRALGAFSSEEACYFFRRAFDLERDSSSVADRARLARRELHLGEALVNLGNYVEGGRHLEQGLRLLGYPVPVTAIAKALGLTSQGLRQIGHRVWPGRAVGKTAVVRDEVSAACRAYNRLFEVFVFGGQTPLSAFSAIAMLNSAESGHLPPMMAVASCLLASILSLIPLRRAAKYYLERALNSFIPSPM